MNGSAWCFLSCWNCTCHRLTEPCIKCSGDTGEGSCWAYSCVSSSWALRAVSFLASQKPKLADYKTRFPSPRVGYLPKRPAFERNPEAAHCHQPQILVCFPRLPSVTILFAPNMLKKGPDCTDTNE